MKDVLLLGAKGMLGTALAEKFADQLQVAWDKDELDITDTVAVKNALQNLRPRIVINAAAYTSVDQAETETRINQALNATAVANLAAICADTNACLVHYSTDYVFPGTNQSGYQENDLPGPAVNTYGAAKLAGEKALQGVLNNYYLIRTAWLYGPNGKNFPDTIMRLARERDELTIVDDQHGSPTYTHDLAHATRQLLEGEYEPGVYHLVNEGQASWYEFAQAVLGAAGSATPVRPIASSEYPLPAARPATSNLKNTKGPRLRPWQEALNDYLTTTRL